MKLFYQIKVYDYDTKQEAERVVHDFGLSKNDGWFIKQAKI